MTIANLAQALQPWFNLCRDHIDCRIAYGEQLPANGQPKFRFLPFNDDTTLTRVGIDCAVTQHNVEDTLDYFHILVKPEKEQDVNSVYEFLRDTLDQGLIATYVNHPRVENINKQFHPQACPHKLDVNTFKNVLKTLISKHFGLNARDNIVVKLVGVCNLTKQCSNVTI